MDLAERTARDWFIEQGFRSVEYEPRGTSTFPDFLLDREIQAEVAWLFQYDSKSGRPLSEKEAPFIDQFRKCLRDIGGPADGKTYFIDVAFSRPLFRNRTELASALRTALLDVIPRADGKTRVYLKPNIWIEAYPASDGHPEKFLLGAWIDYDSGGWVSDFAPRSLMAAVARKIEKLGSRKRIAEQAETWLVLVDRMGCSPDDLEGVEPVFEPYKKLIVLGWAGELARWSR